MRTTNQFTRTLEQFEEESKNQKQFYIYELCSGEDLEYLYHMAKTKQHKNITVVNLTHFSKHTVKQAEYFKQVKKDYDLSLYMKVDVFDKLEGEQVKIELKDGNEVVFTGIYSFMNEMLEDATKELINFESRKYKHEKNNTHRPY